MTAFRTHALVTKERTASPFDYGLSFQEFWTAHPRDRVLGSKTYALSTQITGFPICNPMHDDKHMLKVVQHAAASALINEEELATFILLLNWTESSTNAFHKTSTDNKEVHYPRKHPTKQSALHAPPLPAEQISTFIENTMGHTYPSGVETRLLEYNPLQTIKPG